MTAETTLPTAQALRALGASLLTPELVVFPVRHHSPACAWQLRRLFETLSPSAVLIEGPRSFTPLIPLLAHEEARMPLAIYTYAVLKGGAEAAEQRRAAYYPFCDHSPELIAVREALARQLPARFIDLDFAEQCRLEQGSEQEDDEARTLLDERHFRRSSYLGALAAQLGCRDHDELWEHLFEVAADARPLDEFVGQLAAYCQLARQGATEAELTADGTLQREAEMAWHLCAALAERTAGSGPVLAVVGGFHAVVLPTLVAAGGKRPEIPAGKVSDAASALIRYSFERLDRLNGYGAGMTSPAWHQRIWERCLLQSRAGLELSARQRQEAALALLFDIATELRSRHGVALPVPTLAAAYEHCLQLAALRQRPAPVRDDVLDAVTSCFVKGDTDADGALVLSVAHRFFSGQAMGRVPPGAATPPLVKDFQYRARRQKLKLDEAEPRRSVLEIYRKPEHRVTSRLLHGLVFLGIPFAMRSAGPDFVNGSGLERLQEHWEYGYSVATEAALVEASVHGVTVPLAVANRFGAKLDALDAEGAGRSAREAAQLLMQACVLGLHDHLPRVTALLRAAVAADADFGSVVSATASLALLAESREPLEARELPELPALLQASYERALYLGGLLRSASADDVPLVQSLVALRELLVSAAGRPLDGSLYWTLITTLQQQHESAMLRGAAAGLLYAAGRMDETTLATHLEGHLSGLSQPREAVAFLRGLLLAARETAWQQTGLLTVLDGLLRRWPEVDFVATLPELRLAFAGMTPKETDRIAEAVAALHGAKTVGPLLRYDLSEAEVQAHLAVSATLGRVLADDGLQEWLA